MATPRVDCAWCQRIIRDGEEPVSHGLCPACRDRYFPEIARKLAERDG